MNTMPLSASLEKFAAIAYVYIILQTSRKEYNKNIDQKLTVAITGL